jgi:hypothetical protein
MSKTKSKKNIKRKNKSRKNGGSSPYAINVTGYYSPDTSNNAIPGKLVDIVVNNNLDYDRYFNQYMVYPDKATFLNDLKDFFNFEKDEIKKMNYRLKPFFDASLNKTSDLIPKQRQIVVNSDKDMDKVKNTNELITKLNAIKGGSIFGKNSTINPQTKLKPDELRKSKLLKQIIPKDIEELQNEYDINNLNIQEKIKQLQNYYFAIIENEEIYKNKTTIEQKNLLKNNAFFNIIAKKTELIPNYLPYKILDKRNTQ